MAEHAADEAERILREHHVPPLEAQQDKELDAIMTAAAKEVVKSKKMRSESLEIKRKK